MTISKELYLQRPLPSGNFPIVIRVRHLGKEKIVETSVTCHRRHWDSYRSSVNRRDTAHSIKNNIIDATFRRIAGKIQDYLDKILVDNLDSLLNNSDGFEKPSHSKTKTSVSPQSFPELIKNKIASLSSLNTRRGYEGLMRYFTSQFGKGPDLDCLSEDFINKFKENLEANYSFKSSMRQIIASRFNAVINFGKQNGVIPYNFSLKLPSYSLFPNERALSENTIKLIYKTFSEKIKDDPLLSKTSTLSLALFILDIAFQGLAPVDLANLRVKDISFSHSDIRENKILKGKHKDNGMEIVTVKTLRQKTKVPVVVATVAAPITAILRALMRNKTEDDYLIPCFDRDRQYTPEQRQNRLANFFHKLADCLNEVIHNTNQRITFYFARHAFCNLVDSLDVPRHLIQYLIGHRMTVLERSYLRKITIAEQAAISQRIFQLII